MLQEMKGAVIGVWQSLRDRCSAGTAAVACALLVAGTEPALAQTAYDPISAAVDWTEVGTIIVGILASIAAVYVLWKGGAMAVSAIKRA